MAEGYLLAARGGKRALPYHTVYRAWRIAVETAGIDDVRIHDMRAMSMTELALAHGDLGLAKANAAGGHSTMNQTRDYVRHTLPTRVQGPARRIAPIKAK
jgi:integrase